MNHSYRKKPVVVEAFQMTLERRQYNIDWPSWLHEAWNKPHSEVGAVYPSKFPRSNGTDELVIHTLEGDHLVSFGDYIIRGVAGELYPCKPDIFEATYDAEFAKEPAKMAPGAIEQEIQNKGLTAPRITPADIEANIASEHYFTAADGAKLSEHGDMRDYGNKPAALALLTFCVLVLRNGFTVTGESACASPDNFDAEIGRKIARENAINKVWPLLGYQLKTELMLAEKFRIASEQADVARYIQEEQP